MKRSPSRCTSRAGRNLQHRVFVPQDGLLVYKPDTISLGASAAIEQISWLKYGGKTAVGAGVFPSNDCKPNCAGGTITPKRVTVRLNRRNPLSQCARLRPLGDPRGRLRQHVRRDRHAAAVLRPGTVVASRPDPCRHRRQCGRAGDSCSVQQSRPPGERHAHTLHPLDLRRAASSTVGGQREGERPLAA
jgi:hypothetical protein